MMNQPGRTLFNFVRHWSRRWTGTDARADRGRDVMVIEAVLAYGTLGTTINGIAAGLGIDQSGASRMAASAVARGYLAVAPSPDARTRLLLVTETGNVLAAQAHIWQEQVFQDLTRTWTADEVAVFAHLMNRLIGAEA
jgi:MarR family transcriptional regulator, organic hydroperoxide resistance regulator